MICYYITLGQIRIGYIGLFNYIPAGYYTKDTVPAQMVTLEQNILSLLCLTNNIWIGATFSTLVGFVEV